MVLVHVVWAGCSKRDLFNQELGWPKHGPGASLRASVLIHEKRGASVSLSPSVLLFSPSVVSSFGSLAPAYWRGGCIPKESERKQSKLLRASSRLEPCHFCHILLVKANHKFGPEPRAGELESTPWFHSVTRIQKQGETQMPIFAENLLCYTILEHFRYHKPKEPLFSTHSFF